MNIVPLSKEHDRISFDCGENSINRFLQTAALQDQRLLLSRTCVLVDESADPQRILGFHTLLLTIVDQDTIPDDRPRIKRKIPVVLLGQLGVDVGSQRLGYGNWLLFDVEKRVADVAKNVGVRSLMLDARNEELARWYEKRDFTRFPESLRMFKSIGSIIEAVR